MMFSAKHHLKIGLAGEEIARQFLIKNGYRILIKNYRRKSDELDIIAIAPDLTLVFFEVKTLVRNEGGLMPEDNLSKSKLHKISRTCEFFARQNAHIINEEQGWRIDLIAVDLNECGAVIDIRHYENI